MKKTSILLLLSAVLALGVVPASAGGDESFKFSGSFFFDYFADLTDREDDDQTVTRGFELRRAYATAKKSKGDVTFRFTSDIDYKFGGGNLNVYSKYAYLEHKGLVPGAKLYVGQHSPKTHGWVEKVWKYRSMAKTMSDAAKWTDSAAFGVGLQGKAKEGMFEYYIDVNNGNGYKKAVAKDGFGFSARAVVKPDNGVVASALFQSNTAGGFRTLSYDVDENTTISKSVARDSGNTYIEGVLGYVADRFSLFGQYGVFTNNNVFMVDATNFTYEPGDPFSFPTVESGDVQSSGLSVFGRAEVSEGAYAVARFDLIDPDTDVDDDVYNWLLLGADFEVSEGYYLQPSVRVKSFEDSDVDSETELVVTVFGKI